MTNLEVVFWMMFVEGICFGRNVEGFVLLVFWAGYARVFLGCRDAWLNMCDATRFGGEGRIGRRSVPQVCATGL